MTNADISRIVNSDEVQSVLRPKHTRRQRFVRKKNPMKNRGFMIKLNPYEKTRLRRLFLQQERRKKEKFVEIQKKRAQKKQAKGEKAKERREKKGYYKTLLENVCIHEVQKAEEKKED